MSKSVRRPVVPLLAATLALVASAVTGCATDEEARRAAAEQESMARAAQGDPAASSVPASHEPAPRMQLQGTFGVVDTVDVEDALQARFDDVRACYARAGKAQEYADGRVLLRFLVAGDGHPQDVWVISSSLGNYPVERCLVEVGRSVVFRAPAGRKPTTFEYPVEFRSTNAATVLDIDGLKIHRDVSTFMPQLAACGQLAKAPVVAMMYIEPNGFPGSVGLATDVALDEDAGDCVVQTIQRWRMSAVLPGHVLRANFRIPTVISSAASADPGRHAVSSASVRRRRR
ncbi:MAG TPA: TonB family protein [Polyangia bacterium]|jgi:TonB family protein